MTDHEVIAAIRHSHLKANLDGIPERRQLWPEATVDPGGTLFGPGPYVKLPVVTRWRELITIRVYPPARLRKKLAQLWKPGS